MTLPKPKAKVGMYEANRRDEIERQQAPAADPVVLVAAAEPVGRLSVAPIQKRTLHGLERFYLDLKHGPLEAVNRYDIVQAVLDEMLEDPELQARVLRRIRR